MHAVKVPGRRQRTEQPHLPQPRLFGHFAQGGLFTAFSLFDVSFGKVPPTASPHHEDAPGAVFDDSAGGLHDGRVAEESFEGVSGVLRQYVEDVVIVEFLQQFAGLKSEPVPPRTQGMSVSASPDLNTNALFSYQIICMGF